ncbi:hypothetical protein ACPYO6_09415 [Georgenia sp. Z1344]|uniref:hypothetical protein n=1 Tax=Georgenia sp. Z1344 TaxID=3416706 RepID=UPI003CF69535
MADGVDDGGARAPAPDLPSEQPGTRWARLRPELPWAGGVGVLALLMSVTAILFGTSLSALDEQTHLDYAYQVAHGNLPADGDRLSDYVLDQWSCRGQSNLPDLPSCEDALADEVEPTAYPALGQNYNSFHPPTYYVTPAATGLVAEAVGLEFSTGARFANALWLTAGVVAVYAALRTWRLPRPTAASGAALLLAFEPVIVSGWQVTNDGPAMLVGAGALWVLGRWALHGRIGWLWPTLVALLAAGTKVMSAVAILAVVGLIATMAVADVRRRDWRTLGHRAATVLAPVAVVAACMVGWSRFQAGRGAEGWDNPLYGISTRPVEGSPWDETVPTLFDAFGLVKSSQFPGELTGWQLDTVTAAWWVLMAAAPFMVLVAFGAGRAERLLGLAAIAGTIGAGIIVQGQEVLSSDHAFRLISGRYAITLLPITVAALVASLHHRRLGTFLQVGVAVSVAVMWLSLSGVL